MVTLADVLPRFLFETLDKVGIKTPEQIIVCSDEHLMSVSNLSANDIKIMKDAASSILIPTGFINAYEKKKIEEGLGKISIGCPILDEYFRGGLRPGTLTEIYGESGCGKTQIALQLAANCWESGAVYICTEDVFPSKRLQQMFTNLTSGNKKNNDLSKYGEKIYILQVTELEDLLRCITVQLPLLLTKTKTISVIILDSIAAPFRGEFNDDMKTRAQHLKQIGSNLLSHANSHNLAVLCINQVSAVVTSKENDILPCLGLTWSNLLTTRIKLQKSERFCHINDVKHLTNKILETERGKSSTKDSDMLQIRELKILTSPELPNEKSVDYIITSNGVVGLNS